MNQGLACDAAGYIASALVLATFSMRSMIPLRITAIASNIAFISYALVAHLHPILALHTMLLPVNLFRLGLDLTWISVLPVSGSWYGSSARKLGLLSSPGTAIAPAGLPTSRASCPGSDRARSCAPKTTNS
jgi:hypothetical protein